jgi:hypothetical protein
MADSYSLGTPTAAVTAAGVLMEILNPGAATAPRMRIAEIDVFWASGASTSIQFGLGRPGNTPTTGTQVTGAPEDVSAPAAIGATVITGWGTAPTVPAKYFRQAAIASAGGNGIIWTWPDNGLVVPPNARNNGLVLWCTAIGSATSTTLNVTIRWYE